MPSPATETVSKALAVLFTLVGMMFLLVFVITVLNEYVPAIIVYGALFIALGLLFARPWPYNPLLWFDWSKAEKPSEDETPPEPRARGKARAAE